MVARIIYLIYGDTVYKSFDINRFENHQQRGKEGEGK